MNILVKILKKLIKITNVCKLVIHNSKKIQNIHIKGIFYESILCLYNPFQYEPHELIIL